MAHWSVWILLPAAAAATAIYRTGQWDYWFHLAAGRSIATHGLPGRETWCLSAFGSWPWLSEWLFHVLIYEVRSALGDTGVALWRAGLAAAAMAVAVAVGRRLKASPGVLLAVAPLVLAALRPRQDPRPEQVSLLFTLVFILVLERVREGGSRLPLVWLVPLELAWANLQTLWILGPAVALVYAASEWIRRGEDRKSLARRFALLALGLWITAVVATPRPLDTLTLRAWGEAWSDPGRAYIDELRRWSWGRDYARPFTMVLGLAIGAFAAGGRDVVRQSPAASVLAIAALVSGVLATRQQAFGTLVALPVIAGAWSSAEARKGRWLRILPMLAGLGGAAALVGEWPSYAVGVRPLELAVPIRAVALADSLGLSGPVLNTSWYGGYMLWIRGDGHPPLVDTRNRGTRAFGGLFRRAQTDPAAFDTLLASWRFDYAVVQPIGENPDQLALQLAGRSDWVLVFVDDAGLLYVRRAGYPAVAAALGYRILTPDYVALGQIGTRAATDTTLGNALVAELERARGSSPWHARASLWLGLLRLAQGDALAASRLLGEVERLAPAMPGLALRQGMAYEALGRLEEARAAYRRALTESTDAALARAALGRLP